MKNFWNNFPRYLFLSSIVLVTVTGSMVYGVYSGKRSLPPEPQINALYDIVKEVLWPSDGFLTRPLRKADGEAIEIVRPDDMQPGLLLIAGMLEGRETSVRIINRLGETMHEWRLPWSSVWPNNEGGFPIHRIPRSGMHLHGMDILPSGDLVANFEYLSTFRVDLCNELVWKLDNLGHHSVHFSDDGTLWVSAEQYISAGPTGYPMHRAPLRSWTLQQIDVDGNILREIPVIDIFLENDLMGMLYMSNLENQAPFFVEDDTLHLNDVETFPADWESSVFEPGDILLSLRNIHTVLVVDPQSLEIKFMSTGGFVRQHDPDFMPGDRISVLDNRNYTVDSRTEPRASRIVELDAGPQAGANNYEVVLGKDAERPFFTNIMGTHQRLQNGNILVNESLQGTILEYAPDGSLVYRYQNRINDSKVGVTTAGIVLPEEMSEEFFSERKKDCAG
jgi:hypothetical protein